MKYNSNDYFDVQNFQGNIIKTIKIGGGNDNLGNIRKIDNKRFGSCSSGTINIYNESFEVIS